MSDNVIKLDMYRPTLRPKFVYQEAADVLPFECDLPKRWRIERRRYSDLRLESRAPTLDNFRVAGNFLLRSGNQLTCMIAVRRFLVRIFSLGELTLSESDQMLVAPRTPDPRLGRLRYKLVKGASVER